MRRPFFLAGTLPFFVLFSTLAVAQSAENNQPSSSNSQQSGSASSSPKTKSDPAAKSQEKKPKKVWTNEEVGSLKSTVSVVGGSAAATAGRTSARSGPTAGSGDAERYRQQLAPLRSELAEIDRQIREVKGLGAQGGRYNNTSLDRLEDRKKSIQLMIDAIEEDARRHGIAPGDLR